MPLPRWLKHARLRRRRIYTEKRDTLLLSVASKSGRPQKMVAASIKMVPQPHMGSRTVSHGCMPAVLVTVKHSTRLKPGLGSSSMPDCCTRIGISTVSLEPSRRMCNSNSACLVQVQPSSSASLVLMAFNILVVETFVHAHDVYFRTRTRKNTFHSSVVMRL